MEANKLSAIPIGLGETQGNSVLANCQTSTFNPDSFRRSRTEKSQWESRNRMFILGMGFVGQFFANELKKKQNWIVSGTCKSLIKKKELEGRGFDVHLFDANDPQLEILNTLKSYTHLLVSIPPLVGDGDPMLQHGQHLRTTLMDGSLRWLCYLSSTSVYGHSDGAWADEDCPTSPISESAKLRLVAEEGWLNLAYDLGVSAHVFRLGGIYGPGRSALDTIIKQKPLSNGQKMRLSTQYTSRVHVEDICQALDASIYRPSSRKIYNIVDDDPSPREEVFAYARTLVEKKWPSRLKQSVSPERAESLSQEITSRGEKRVSNAHMKNELGVRLLHPSFRSGLLSIFNQMENPFP
ncbi:Epimerase domain-containing protein [Cephalotus follicularis]|uniref:Epimerase domain-containing protein n=1 Tax=Cephalotus follicularis TaxID=3775 RepID=A0A1Q3AML4_CEPFO|nr:Epimerase domain-containing protein [Cephalotus follicularis]